MISRLGLKLGEWLSYNGYIGENQVEVVRYAFEIVCSEFTEILFIIIYGIYSSQVVETILYLLFFQFLRHVFQGYHAKTIFRCFILTIGTYLLSMLLYAHMDLLSILISLMLSSIFQLEYCIRKREVKPILVSVMFWVFAFTIGLIEPYFSVLQMLAIVEFIVSISLFPERRNYSYE